MKPYYFDFEGGGEISISAESEEEAREKCKKMFPLLTVTKVWHA